MRLIDADALLDNLTMGSIHLGYQEIEDIEEYVKKMPTIEERKKGHWISLDDFRGKYNTWGYKCSECGEHSEYEENYCPNCGAGMRGESIYEK